ncbi:MAG TPA: phosphoribosyltransferase family protein [Kiloniellales bacterium]|nr:phosphoribosyltransferase family protein [Kiloniellales bacterium]
MFSDRSEAGRALATRLSRLKHEAPVVLALPRGGVPVAYEIAIALEAPLDLILVSKIGVPWQPELAAGAVVDGERPEVVENEEVVRALSISAEIIATGARRKLEEVERRRKAYLGDRKSRVPLAGRTAIVVDDGIATGTTARAALRAVRRAVPKHLVLAVPVAPPDSVAALESECDEIVCLEVPPDLGAIGSFYADFRQVSDEEVIDCLTRARDAVAGIGSETDRA